MTIDQNVSSWRTPMLQALAERWWLLLLRGIAAVIFGVLAFVWPGLTLLTLVIIYGAYALLDGVLALVAAFTGGAKPIPTWWLVIVGVLGIAAGLVTFLYPGVTALVLLVFIAVWSIARGVFEIIGAIQLRKELENEWLLILAGAMSVVFGVLILVWPGAGALALVWLIGAYAIIFGALFVGFALRLRRHRAEARAVR
jgi:uncharacterized membrane protein HdeD (DUF308 family)